MATSSVIQTIMSQNGVQMLDIFQRTRTDLNAWARFQITGNTAGSATLAPASLIPGLITYPCLIIQNNGIVPVTLSFKALNGNSASPVLIPVGDYTYIPQVDYATGIVSLTTASGVAPCVGYFGYSQ